jgi:large repetitive protein
VSVHYTTADGSATLAGGDYQATSGDLTFAPGGPLTQTVTVLVIGDRVHESVESVIVRLSDVTNAFVADAKGLGNIQDDEPYINIVGYVPGLEGNTGTTPFHFTVTLSGDYDVPVTVEYATADLTQDEEYWYGPGATAGVDYEAKTGTLTFKPGEPLTQDITVQVIGDRVGELDEYWGISDELFFVNFSNPTNGLLNSSQATGFIQDDEPLVSIDGGGSVLEGHSGTKTMTYTVTLAAVYDADVTVSYATANGSASGGSDYVAATETVTIPAGQRSQDLTVLVNGDLLAESDEYFYVNLTGATGAVISSAWAIGYILDDDTPPTFRIGDATVVEGNSGTKLMTFTVSLSQASGQSVSVNYATANGTATVSNNDYVAKSGNVFFAPGETSKTITITIQGDTKKEKDEQFYVNLSGPIGGTLADGQGVGTIVNDDGGGKGNASGNGNKESLSASAVDAALEDWMSSARKKKSR